MFMCPLEITMWWACAMNRAYRHTHTHSYIYVLVGGGHVTQGGGVSCSACTWNGPASHHVDCEKSHYWFVDELSIVIESALTNSAVSINSTNGGHTCPWEPYFRINSLLWIPATANHRLTTEDICEISLAIVVIVFSNQWNVFSSSIA